VRQLLLEEVEVLLASKALVVDACRNVVRDTHTVVSLVTRPVLFALARALGEVRPAAACDAIHRRILRRVDPRTGEVLERIDMPHGIHVSGLESNGGDQFFCGGGKSGKVRTVRRPKLGAV
jgi:hypothetical protein